MGYFKIGIFGTEWNSVGASGREQKKLKVGVMVILKREHISVLSFVIYLTE